MDGAAPRLTATRPELALCGLGAARIGLGLVALAVPRLVRFVLPRAADTADGRAVVRMLGARDLALGLATVVAVRRRSRVGVRVVALATIVSDAADAAVSTSSSAPPLVRITTAGSAVGGAVLTALAVRAHDPVPARG